jgi:hypothetical protein
MLLQNVFDFGSYSICLRFEPVFYNCHIVYEWLVVDRLPLKLAQGSQQNVWAGMSELGLWDEWDYWEISICIVYHPISSRNRISEIISQ